MNNKEVFDIYDQMFAMPAWKDLINDLKMRQEELPKQLINSSSVGEKELYRAQGVNQVFGYIINLEASMEQAKKQMEEDKELPDVALADA